MWRDAPGTPPSRAREDLLKKYILKIFSHNEKKTSMLGEGAEGHLDPRNYNKEFSRCIFLLNNEKTNIFLGYVKTRKGERKVNQ